MKREAYIDIPTANLNQGFYIVVNSSYPIKDVDDVKLDPNIGINFTYDNYGGALKWYDGSDFALDFSYQILSGYGNIPCIAVGFSDINVNKYISTAGTDEVFNDEDFTHRPPESWSFYVVASKKLNRLIEVNAGLGRGKFVGYGTLYKHMNTDMFTDGNHEIWAFGLFGGMKIIFTNSMAFIAEGDGRDVNIGLEYQNQLIKGTLAFTKLEVFNNSEQDFSPRVGLNVSYKIMSLREEARKEKKKLPVSIELIDNESRAPVEGKVITTDTKGDTVEISKDKSIHPFKLEPGIYTAFISATGYKDKEIDMMVKEETDKNLYTIELSGIEEPVKLEEVEDSVKIIETEESVKPEEIEDSVEIIKIEEPAKPEEVEDSVKIIDNFEYIKNEIDGIRIKFPFRKAKLTPTARDKLKRIIELISDNKDFHLLIIGHTCSIGTQDSNLILSKKRAESAKKYLTKHHIPAGSISTKGYGETKPVADNNTEEGRIENRRVEFRFSRSKDK